MPMIPDLAFVMLACARIGAVHSVVFAGFSADSLRDRIADARSKWVITADEGLRGGRAIALKATVDVAVSQTACVQKVFVYAHTGADVTYGVHDVRMAPELAAARPFCSAVAMDAEDPLFMLYTSGSTGKPKGVAHTTGGYLLYAALTTKYVFDLRAGDVYACVADCGWITGHTYIVYGPLANGATTLMFESTPLFPDASRYWDLVQTHKVTQFYTAPTAIRALMKFGDAPVKKHDLSTLRVLGSVGEPINPEVRGGAAASRRQSPTPPQNHPLLPRRLALTSSLAHLFPPAPPQAWRWYHSVVGGGQCAVVDTFWQTETGGHMITGLPGAHSAKPGSASFPFFGVDIAIMDKDGRELVGNNVSGVVCVRTPWPGIARTIFGDHERYLATYMQPFPGFYFTGDGGVRDRDGYIWITGRVDDVLNVSGHRLGSAELESALVLHPKVAEAAVIGFPHDTKGEGICCYVSLKEGVEETPAVAAELRNQVRKVIGPFATPDHVILTSALPKTRSGKIMRRVLRKIIAQQTDQLGDISTLADSGVVHELIRKVESALGVKLPALA